MFSLSSVHVLFPPCPVTPVGGSDGKFPSLNLKAAGEHGGGGREDFMSQGW